MGEGSMVKYEVIGQRGAGEVYNNAEEPGASQLTFGNTIGREKWEGDYWYHVIRYKLNACLQMLSRVKALIYAYCEGSSWRNWVAGW